MGLNVQIKENVLFNVALMLFRCRTEGFLTAETDVKSKSA